MVFKVAKSKNYTIMSNFHLRDKNLSLKAKGLLSFMLSLPENWDYSLNGLVSVSKESKKAIRTILKELKENGYLVVEQQREKNGYYKYNYVIYEQPVEVEKQKDNPDTPKGYTVEGDSEKDTQINTNKINTKQQIDKIDKTKSSIFEIDNLNDLTKDLIERGYIEKDDLDIYKYNKLFNELLKKYNYKDLLIINHYIISKVKERNFYDEYDELITNKFGYFQSALLSNINKFTSKELEWDEEAGWFKEAVDEIDLDLDY